MNKTIWLFLVAGLMLIAIGLLAFSRKRAHTASGKISGVLGCLILAYSGWHSGGLVPVVGNWVSFFFVTVAGLALLIVLSDDKSSQSRG